MDKHKKKKNHWWLFDEFMNKLPMNIRENVPNTLTGVRVISSIGIVVTLLTIGLVNPILIGTWTALTAITDLLDGKIARRYNCQSKLGSALDAIADKVLNWGVGITLIIMGVVPVWSLLIGIRDLTVLTQNAKYKIEDGKKQRNNEKRTKNKFKEMIKDYKQGELLPPTILGKVKMWGQSAAVISGLLFNSTPLALFTPILFGATIAISAGDVILNTKIINTKKKNWQKENKNITESKVTSQETLDNTNSKETKKSYPRSVERSIDQQIEYKEDEKHKVITKKY